jgi:hypothetical protein
VFNKLPRPEQVKKLLGGKEMTITIQKNSNWSREILSIEQARKYFKKYSISQRLSKRTFVLTNGKRSHWILQIN